MEKPRWLAHAWKLLGENEIAGGENNARILRLFRDAGHGEASRDEIPWCAAFVGACLERAAVKSTRSLMARSYLDWGIDVGDVQNPLGAIAVLSRGRDLASGHVGFLVGESADKVWLLGGNQGDSVSVSVYSRSRLLGLRWAKTAGEVVGQGVEDAGLFDTALAHVLKMEGGFTNDPVDPGGPTNKGITLAVYAAWKSVQLSGRTRARLLAELKDISDTTVRGIYESRYWRKGSCPLLPGPVAVMHFDACVNHGVGAAIRMLQRAIDVDVDGVVGPETLGAARGRRVDMTLKFYAVQRRARYRSLHHFWRFGRGWLRRVDATLEVARTLKEMGGSAGARAERDGVGGDQKRRIGMGDSAKRREAAGSKWWGSSITIWGALVTAAATVLPALAQSAGVDLSPDLVKKIGIESLSLLQALIGLVGTVATIYGRFRATDLLVQRSMEIKL